MEVEGHPNLSVYAPQNRVAPGETVQFELFANNVGVIEDGGPFQYENRVTTARGVRFFVSADDAPVEVRTDPVVAGTIPQGSAGPFPVSLVVDEDAEPGTYELTVEARYQYTETVDYGGGIATSYSEANATEEFTVDLVVTEQADFTLTNKNASVQVGETGSLTLGIQNVGSATARRSVVVFNATDPELQFGTGIPSAQSFAGRWQPDERKRFDLDVFVAPNATARRYVVTATVLYRDQDGRQRRSDPIVIGVEPLPRQTFAVDPIDATFEVDSNSVLTVAVTNTGPRTVENVEARVLTEEPISSDDPTAFVSRLEPNETTRLAVDLSVSDDAIAKQTAVRMQFSYEVDGSDPSLSETYAVPIQVTQSESQVPVLAIVAVAAALAVAGIWWWRRR